MKPVLTIQGEKLDAFAKARTTSQGKTMMINAIKKDINERFGGMTEDKHIWLQIAYTHDRAAAEQFRTEVEAEFPGYDIHIDPLSLSVACHIGPGSLALACCKKSTCNFSMILLLPESSIPGVFIILSVSPIPCIFYFSKHKIYGILKTIMC